MPENIFKLIQECTYNHSSDGTAYLEKMINEIVLDKKLQDYVKNVRFVSDIQYKDKNCYGRYTHEDKTILLGMNELDNRIEHEIINNRLLSDEEKKYGRLLLPLQTALHEIEHARQLKVMTEEDNFESRLLSLSSAKIDVITYAALIMLGLDEEKIKEYFINEVHSRYKFLLNNPEYLTRERMAEITSYRELLNYIKNFRLDLLNLNNKFQFNLNRIMSFGYTNESGKITSPVEVLMAYLWDKFILYTFPWYSDNYDERLKKVKNEYSIDKRLLWGLPIDSVEYSRIRMKERIFEQKSSCRQ